MNTVPKRELSVFDSTCVIVGIIIGVGIYETAPTVAASMGSWPAMMAVWLVGGLLAFAGALCYAELASAYPYQGGDYVYLGRAYGGWAGYMFGWSQLAIIRPGDIALMAFVFARYAKNIYAAFDNCMLLYAAAAVAILTLVNIMGVKQGKWTQNVLTLLKAIGLLGIVIAGLAAPQQQAQAVTSGSITLGGTQLALILVLFTYGGWHEIAYVAAEVRNPKRNILRAMIIGTVSVTVLYLLVNAAFARALGFEGMANSEAVAVDTVAAVLPSYAGRAINILVCISALGAINGIVLTGARISYAMGKKHRSFRVLGGWSAKRGTPVRALVAQGAISVAIILFSGSFIDTILYSAPVFWLFFLATGISVFVLRHKEPSTERPYKITGYPVVPIIFCLSCAFMLYSCITFGYNVKPEAFGILLAVVAVGAVLYLLTELGQRAREKQD